MNLTVELLESNSDIAKLILNQIKDIIQQAINKALPKITNEIKATVDEALRNQPEYTSLMSGKLKAELGIPDSSVVDRVIQALVDTLIVTNNGVKTSSSGISGGFKLTMIKSDDIGGVINIDEASVVDDKGYSLPWLEWLLLKGNQTIVKNYSVKYTSSTRSRSGLAIMQPDGSFNWRVPSEFSGSQQNNWTTRAIDSIEKEIYQIMTSNIEKNL